MKVLLINGSPKAKGNTAFALEQMAEVFADQGIDTEILHVGHLPIRGCIACGYCSKTGKCTFDDIVNEAVQKLQEADGMVVGSPVYFASSNATLNAFLDRLFYSAHFDKRMKVGACVTVARRGGCSATFDQLNKYFTIQPLLELHPWLPPRRSPAGSGGHRNRTKSCQKHGISHKVHCTWKGNLWAS